MRIFKKITISLLLVIILLPLGMALAQGRPGDYEPISPVKNLSVNEGGNVPEFEDYLNNIFSFSLSIGAILAVVQIAFGGMRYMTSSVVSSKESAKEQIRSAILGLLLLFSIYIILNIINPNILSFRIGRNISPANQQEGTAPAPERSIPLQE